MNKDIQTKSSRPYAHTARVLMRTHTRKLNVLIACEESQAECLAFRSIGCNAYSCDIQPCRKNGRTEFHIQGDVTPYLHGKVTFKTMDGKRHRVKCWNLIIAHPPCTYLCKVGSPHLYKYPDTDIIFNGKPMCVNGDRLQKLREARQFFFECLNAKAPYVAVENPLPMRLAELPSPTCYACPSWFGVKYTKKTLYWLRNLPPLMAECVYSNPKSFVRSSRGKYRSRTFTQMALAIARQWTEYIYNDNSIQL